MRLTIILPTEAKLEESERCGLLTRWKTYFLEMSRVFDVEIYSCDVRNYSKELRIKHHPLPFSIGFIPYGNQIFYNIFVLLRAKKMTGTLRVISVSYFILPFLKMLGKKIILSYQYDYETTTQTDCGGIKGFTASFRERLSILSSDVIIATTVELENKAREVYKKDAVCLIPNFVDTSKFIPLEKEKFVLYAGRIYWHKGLDYLLEAFAKIESEYPDLLLKLAGSGNIEEYRDKARKLGIENIRFLGPIDNSVLAEIMGKAKIFVLPTVTREGNPKALIEAMACGCACIATDVKGNRELIKDGINGLLAKPEDSQSLIEAIRKVLSDEVLDRRVSQNSINSAMDFSVRNTLHKEIKLLQQMVMQEDV